jgi:hypothetical protein
MQRFQFDRAEPTPASYRFSTDQPATIAASETGKARRFAGVAYSGDVIEGHWYWDRVVFDLSSTKAPQKLPMLMGHDRDKVAGFTDSVAISSQIDVAGVLSSITPDGKLVAETSDEGFPWQQSVHIEPRRVDQIKAGEKVTVNGRQFEGPINVFRDNVIREISFTPTGWDSQTSAVAMSHGNQPEGAQTMTPEQIKQLQDNATKFEAEAATAKAALAKAEADKAAAEEKVKEFERKELAATQAKREEAVKKLFADTGGKYTPENAKPYLELDDSAFEVISAQLRESAKQTNPALFEEQATRGNGGGDAGDANALAEKARELMFAAQREGRHLDSVDAVKQAKKLLAA